jgi:hypothetical protein
VADNYVSAGQLQLGKSNFNADITDHFKANQLKLFSPSTQKQCDHATLKFEILKAFGDKALSV